MTNGLAVGQVRKFRVNRTFNYVYYKIVEYDINSKHWTILYLFNNNKAAFTEQTLIGDTLVSSLEIELL